jgi:hypothetical protein
MDGGVLLLAMLGVLAACVLRHGYETSGCIVHAA